MHIRKLPSGKWNIQAYAGYDPKSGKKVTKSFSGSDLKILKYEAAAWENEMRNVTSIDTIGGAIDKYIASNRNMLSPSTVRGYLSLRKNYPGWFVKTPCAALSAALLARFVSEANASPKTIKNRLGLVSAALKAQGFTMPSVKTPQVDLPELNIPDAETVKRTLNVADPELKICIMLAATGPMRLGEICALRLEDIEGNTIHVRRNLVYGPDHAYHEKGPKTKKSDRYIDMPADLIAEIRKQGYVTRFTPKGLEKRFRTLLRHNNIPHYRFHDLRHFCISELLSQGIDEIYVSERSGHTDHATMQRYIHVLGNRRKEASEKILSHFSKTFT